MKKNILLTGLAALSLQANAGISSNFYINEICVDPQQDRNGDGRITGSDEFFEIFNPSNVPASLDAMIEFIDTSPRSRAIHTIIPAFGFYTIFNPEGEQNNNGRIELWSFDKSQTMIDAFSYGNWPGNNNIPDGNSHSLLDESLCRFPDGSGLFVKTYATPNSANIPQPISTIPFAGLAYIYQRRRK